MRHYMAPVTSQRSSAIAEDVTDARMSGEKRREVVSDSGPRDNGTVEAAIAFTDL